MHFSNFSKKFFEKFRKFLKIPQFAFVAQTREKLPHSSLNLLKYMLT